MHPHPRPRCDGSTRECNPLCRPGARRRFSSRRHPSGRVVDRSPVSPSIAGLASIAQVLKGAAVAKLGRDLGNQTWLSSDTAWESWSAEC